MYRDCIQEHPDGCLLSVRILPRSSANRIVGMHGARLKIAVTAPPLDNRANKVVLEFLADKFNISRKDVVLASGNKSRDKKVLICGLNMLELLDLLD